MRSVPILFVIGVGVAAGFLLNSAPVVAAVLVLAALGALIGGVFSRQLPQSSLILLGFVLAGYATLGRGFAYLGIFPFFVGEVVLFVCLLALLFSGGRRESTSGLRLLIYGFMAWGAFRTIPYVGSYGVNAIRDAVVWGYAIFAAVVSILLIRTETVDRVPNWYVRLASWMLLWMPIAFLVQRFALDQIPLLGSTGVPILDLKGGDMAVHLVGIAAFLMLGIDQDARRFPGWVRVFGWPLWAITAILLVSGGRSALLTISLGVLIVVLIRPARSAWVRPAAAGLFVIGLLALADLEIAVPGGRSIGTDQIVANIQSIFGGSGHEELEGTRTWRLLWWTTIVNYTVFGEYFWVGKGYGINLAIADGFAVSAEGLRSPHNGHVTILARSGVPGLLLWVLLQLSFAGSLLRAYFRARGAGLENWARLNLWVLAYWTAFMINTGFDVFLEGPQGGIWFWSLMGYGIALLHLQRQADLNGYPHPAPSDRPYTSAGAPQLRRNRYSNGPAETGIARGA